MSEDANQPSCCSLKPRDFAIEPTSNGMPIATPVPANPRITAANIAEGLSNAFILLWAAVFPFSPLMLDVLSTYFFLSVMHSGICHPQDTQVLAEPGPEYCPQFFRQA